MDLKPVTSYLSSVVPATALAMGCSDFSSSEAAYFNISLSLKLTEKLITSVTPNSPLVRVPVLSKIMASIFLALSKAALFLIRRPFLAEIAVDTATTRGIARPRAWGQVMTITVTVRSSEKARSLFIINSHIAKVMVLAEMEIKVNHK